MAELNPVPSLADDYQRDGFIKYSNVIDPDRVRRVRVALARMTYDVARSIGIPHVSANDVDALIDCVLPEIYRTNLRASGFIYDTINAHSSVAALYDHPCVVDISAALLGADDMEIVKHEPNFVVQISGDDRNINGWHQESGYYCDFLSAEKSMFVWIPVSHIPFDGGAIWVVPGSHRDGALSHCENDFDERKNMDWDENGESFLNKSLFDVDNAVQIEASIGDLIALDFNLVHKSGHNTSPATRLTAILRLGSYMGRNFLPKYKLSEIGATE